MCGKIFKLIMSLSLRKDLLLNESEKMKVKLKNFLISIFNELLIL